VFFFGLTFQPLRQFVLVRSISSEWLRRRLPGFLVGGLISSKFTADRWKHENVDTKFVSQFHAQRTLNDVVLKNFVVKGCYWGARIGVFVRTIPVPSMPLTAAHIARD
jgi:hypothetical protein